MSLSSDHLNGHPTASDPKPHERSGVLLAHNGWPAARAAREAKAKAGTPAEQIRRVKMAAGNKTRAIRAKRNKKLLKIYDVPAPIKVPGEDGLYSRWMVEHESKKTVFKNVEEFCAYLLRNFGDAEKDEQWRAFCAEADPEEDAEELLAEETQQAIDNIERQSTSKPPIPTAELAPDFTTSEATAPAQIDSMAQ